MKYKWKSSGYSQYYYDANTGRIVGEINNSSLVGPNWSVTVERDYMGHYISEDFARMAVENQIAKNDKDNEEYAKKQMQVTVNDELISKYWNIVLSVVSKHEGESRYDTALRYVREAEERCHTGVEQKRA